MGNLDGDGKQEVVVDEDGSILRDLGLVPASVNGFGLSGGVIDHGEAVINDMYLLINGSRTNFDRQATEIHELGHTLGLAHSSVGFSTGTDGALSPRPTMYPFSISTNDRQSLEADDRASLSELYPMPKLHDVDGHDHRIRDPLRYGRAGARRQRAGDQCREPEDPAHAPHRLRRQDRRQLHDQRRPAPGLGRLRSGHRPERQGEHPGRRSGDGCRASFKVEGSSPALLIDITGSMGPEIGAVKTGLNAMITALAAAPGDFPTAIMTFDDAALINVVSRDPDRLRNVIAALTLHSTSDCPRAIRGRRRGPGPAPAGRASSAPRTRSGRLARRACSPAEYRASSPEIKTPTPNVTQRYSNTLANIAISAARPAVAAVNPSALPQATTLDIELTGSQTGFRAGSTVAIAGSGVAVVSTDVLSPTRMMIWLAVAPGAATGFRNVHGRAPIHGDELDRDGNGHRGSARLSGRRRRRPCCP